MTGRVRSCAVTASSTARSPTRRNSAGNPTLPTLPGPDAAAWGLLVCRIGRPPGSKRGMTFRRRHRDNAQSRDEKMGEYGVGQSVPREEDPYLLRGAGRYVDDMAQLGLLRAFVLRSPHAHARIRSIDVSAARSMPGAVLALAGDDPAVAGLGTQKPNTPRKRRDGSPAFACSQPALARDTVRYIGEPLAFVHEAGNKAAADAAFATAFHVVKHRMVINRLTTNAMEPRGAIADYDARDQRLTLRCTAQGPHQFRRFLAADVFKVPETKIRVIAENVGGGFGMKGGLYPEYILCCLAAKLAGAPVKWIGERGESLLSDEHCRDNITEAELALDADGKFVGLRARTYANLGAYYHSDRSAG